MNLFELAAKITLDSSEYEKGIGEATKSGKSFANTIGGAIKTATKVGAAAIGAFSTGVTAITGIAIKSYAEYEQLVGGVDTLFKESSKTVQKYAENAYKTAGLSANQYMETATGFAASLLQSLGGDTEKAAQYADRAITDMSDNANKMGTSIQSIQYAYQGFAKQNFTMLDNLKLGYGGTQAEMQRLLDDAGKLSGQKFDISSYADIVDAIHIVQTEMGITGTTAKEAAETISGSVASMKSAFSNLMVGVANDNANFKDLTNTFVESVSVAASNILPRIEIALVGVGEIVENLFPVIMERIPQIMDETLPKIFQSGVKILESIIDGLFSNADKIVETTLKILMMLIETVVNNLPKIILLGVKLVTSFIEGILSDPEKLIQTAFQIIYTLSTAIVESVFMIVESAFKIVSSFVGAIGEKLKDVVEAGKRIVESIKKGISSAWEGLKNWFNNLWNGLFGNREVNVNVNQNVRSGGTNGSYAKGLNYVPFDGFVATLHKGEMVLNKRESDRYRREENYSGVTIVQNISAVPQTPAEIAAATQSYFEQARWAF